MKPLPITVVFFKILSVIFLSCSSLEGALHITEFMANNNESIEDEDGDASDWIEIFNSGSEPVSLDGYFLTDDINEPEKWMFPDIEISGEGHLLIWTDNDTEDGYLHTNFKLSADGEEVALFDPDLNLVDFIQFDEQTDDISFGRVLDGDDNWDFLNQPTPGASNYYETSCLTGDVNCDSELNVLDVVQLVSFILGNGELTDEQQNIGDINSDGNIDVLDVVAMVSLILN